jgi:GTP-binding protein EngB required for normal cell division
MDPSEIRNKIGRFRILIIGRANAGKTTILQRVCNTREKPEIYNSAGKKIDAAVLIASRERGLHDINNEMVFRSNPGFVFHDSRGFEAGGEEEFEKVQAFIANRSKETKLRNQLHAIWYCIPMDEAHRSVTKAETKFFSQCDTGSIPVIVLFTKFDALYNSAYEQLRLEGTLREEAEGQAPKLAEESFAIGPQLELLYHSKDIQRPPKCHVCLPNMNEDDADCGSLMQSTAATLDDEAVEQLFVSTQQSNLKLCMKYAVERTLTRFVDSDDTVSSGDQWWIIGRSGAWFPHIWARYYYDDVRDLDVLDLLRDLDVLLLLKREKLDRSDCEKMQSRLFSVAFGSSPLENILQLGSAAVIVFEHSFFVFDKSHHLQHRRQSVPSFYVALEEYMESPHAAAVREAVSAAVQAYEAAVTPAAHAYQEAVTTASRAYEEAVATAAHAYEEAVRTSHTWRAKLPIQRLKKKAKEASERSRGERERSMERARETLERSKEKAREALEYSKEKEKQASEHSKKEKQALCSHAKAELLKTIVEISLNHRLPRP